MTLNGLSLSRWIGIIVKEFIQLKRDRLTFGMIIGIPVVQLILFGFAINSDPKQLPAAILAQDNSVYSRTLLHRGSRITWRAALRSPDERSSVSSVNPPR